MDGGCGGGIMALEDRDGGQNMTERNGVEVPLSRHTLKANNETSPHSHVYSISIMHR